MPNLFIGHITGDTLPAADWQTNWNLVESSFADLGNYVISGLVPSIGTGLSVNVTAGTALIAAHVAVAAGFVIASLTPSTTNYLYLLQNGTGTSNTSGTPPANSVILGTAVTSGVAVTAVNINRSSTRQAWVAPSARVPGGPGAGNPGSVSLASWAAAAADSVTVFGTLPDGAHSSNVPLKANSNTFTATQTITSTSGDALILNVNSNAGLTLNQTTAGNKRVAIKMNNVYQFGTDSTQANVADWWLFNNTTGNFVIQASATDLLTLGSSAAAGGAVLGTATGKIAFFAATPVVRTAAYTLAGTVTRVLPTDPSGAYTGIASGVAGTPYAQLTDLNTLRTAVSTLLGVVRQLLTDLGSTSGYGLLNA